MRNMKIRLVLFAVVPIVGVVGSAFAWQKPESNIVKIVRDGNEYLKAGAYLVYR